MSSLVISSASIALSIVSSMVDSSKSDISFTKGGFTTVKLLVGLTCTLFVLVRICLSVAVGVFVEAYTGIRLVVSAIITSRIPQVLFLVFILTTGYYYSDILEEPRGFFVSFLKPLFHKNNSIV